MKRLFRFYFLLFFLFSTPSFAAEPRANKIKTDTSAFNNNLGSGDTTVQLALDTIDNMSFGHDAVTLGIDADVLLGLSTQQLTIDSQAANLIFASPGSGAAADPTFRALVDNDVPNMITASNYQPLMGVDDNYVTDAEKVVIGNTSGTNTGDNTVATTGDSATSFFSGGTLEVAIGGTGTTTSTGTGSVVLGTTPTFTTSIILPQGTNPTVGTAGNINIDTTDDQLLYYGGALRTIPYTYERCFTLESPVAADDNVPIWSPLDAITVTGLYCRTQGGTSAGIIISDGINDRSEERRVGKECRSRW